MRCGVCGVSFQPLTRRKQKSVLLRKVFTGDRVEMTPQSQQTPQGDTCRSFACVFNVQISQTNRARLPSRRSARPAVPAIAARLTRPLVRRINRAHNLPPATAQTSLVEALGRSGHQAKPTSGDGEKPPFHPPTDQQSVGRTLAKVNQQKPCVNCQSPFLSRSTMKAV